MVLQKSQSQKNFEACEQKDDEDSDDEREMIDPSQFKTLASFSDADDRVPHVKVHFPFSVISENCTFTTVSIFCLSLSIFQVEVAKNLYIILKKNEVTLPDKQYSYLALNFVRTSGRQSYSFSINKCFLSATIRALTTIEDHLRKAAASKNPGK